MDSVSELLDLDSSVGPPVIDAENPAVHLVHVTGCQQGEDSPFLVSWCNIAVDFSAQRGAGPAVDMSQMCAACLRVIRLGGLCPACRESVSSLIARGVES